MKGVDKIAEALVNNQLKINLTQNSTNIQEKDSSSTLKMNGGQINIKNIKVN